MEETFPGGEERRQVPPEGLLHVDPRPPPRGAGHARGERRGLAPVAGEVEPDGRPQVQVEDGAAAPLVLGVEQVAEAARLRLDERVRGEREPLPPVLAVPDGEDRRQVEVLGAEEEGHLLGRPVDVQVPRPPAARGEVDAALEDHRPFDPASRGHLHRAPGAGRLGAALHRVAAGAGGDLDRHLPGTVEVVLEEGEAGGADGLPVRTEEVDPGGGLALVPARVALEHPDLQGPREAPGRRSGRPGEGEEEQDVQHEGGVYIGPGEDRPEDPPGGLGNRLMVPRPGGWMPAR